MVASEADLLLVELTLEILVVASEAGNSGGSV